MAADVVMQDLSSERWAHVDRLLDRKGPLATDAFVPGEVCARCTMVTPVQPTKQMLRELLRVLVVGAGGLGCELLKDLTLMGFLNLDVIDMDRIEVTNLNRQFLFRKGDVGQPKAEVAAKFVNARIPGAHVTPHFAKIQDKDEEFYRQFHIIVLAYDDQGNLRPETSVPMVDGGTEGFKGHVRVIRPGISACFECTLDMFPPQVAFPLCTLAEIPRTPAHCIEWARIIRWGEVFPDKSLDLDDPDCMKWLYNTALGRAEEFGIQGVTYQLTQGVSKNIIPAIASTNAVVAGACANETFKLATGVCSTLDDYMMFMGATGLYTDVQKPERKEDCIACSNIPIRYTLSRATTLQQLLDKLVSDSRAQCKAPSITSASRSLYLRGALEATTRANLALSVGELVAEEEALTVTDPVFHRGLQLRLRYTD